MLTNEITLAWMAGFFDGEGTVLVERAMQKECRHGFRTVLHVAVTQTSTPCLEIFKAHFAGSIITARNRTPRGRRWAVQHRWVVRNEQALLFLHAIAPYAVVKKEQVAAALEYPLYDATGRKFGSLKSPITDSVVEKRLAIRSALQQLRADSKEPAAEAP